MKSLLNSVNKPKLTDSQKKGFVQFTWQNL